MYHRRLERDSCCMQNTECTPDYTRVWTPSAGWIVRRFQGIYVSLDVVGAGTAVTHSHSVFICSSRVSGENAGLGTL